MCEREFKHHGFYGHPGGHGFDLRGCCCVPWRGCFPSREDQTKILEDYRKSLEEELAQVNERLEDLKK
jgi:hypothetical protein